jgi:hypothetical protein
MGAIDGNSFIQCQKGSFNIQEGVTSNSEIEKIENIVYNYEIYDKCLLEYSGVDEYDMMEFMNDNNINEFDRKVISCAYRNNTEYQTFNEWVDNKLMILDIKEFYHKFDNIAENLSINLSKDEPSDLQIVLQSIVDDLGTNYIYLVTENTKYEPIFIFYQDEGNFNHCLNCITE